MRKLCRNFLTAMLRYWLPSRLTKFSLYRSVSRSLSVRHSCFCVAKLWFRDSRTNERVRVGFNQCALPSILADYLCQVPNIEDGRVRQEKRL